MSIAIAQMRVQPGAPMENTALMLSLIDQAKSRGAELIVFPELAVSGLLLGELAQSEAFYQECRACGERIAAAAQDIMVIYGNLCRREGRLYNSVFLAAQGENGSLSAPLGPSYIRGAYQDFAPSPDFQVYNLSLDGKIFRVAFILGDWRRLRLPYSPNEVDLLIDVTNKPLWADEDIVPAGLPGRQLLCVNSYGLQNSGKSNYLFAGGSAYYDFDGSLIARGDDFGPGLYFWQRKGGSILPQCQGDQRLCQALVCGVREFMAQIRCHKAVVGISGGIDSALAACIYTQALGPENVYLISMPSRYNSEQTKNLAQSMARGLGVSFATLPIQDGVNSLLADFHLQPFHSPEGQELELTFSNAVKENVQARERCRLLSAAAAALGAVFTCNGNKAELSVGYATFYGDLAGAFAAQADLWKYQVYRAADWFQRQFPEAPLAEIAAIRPSAELSESQDVTKGLGDPLIYAYHDYLLRYWVEQGADLYDTLAHYQAGDLEQTLGCTPGLAAKHFPGPKEFTQDAEYWWSMYRGMAVAKRLQAPPLLALSAHPFGEGKPQSQLKVYISQEYQRLKARLLDQADPAEAETAAAAEKQEPQA